MNTARSQAAAPIKSSGRIKKRSATQQDATNQLDLAIGSAPHSIECASEQSVCPANMTIYATSANLRNGCKARRQSRQFCETTQNQNDPDVRPYRSEEDGMVEDNRVEIVKRLLFDYVKSPSLRHIKDPYMVIKLAQEIVRNLDRGDSAWTKWTGAREQLVKSATSCWIPAADLRDHLNQMNGPVLTTSDVEQRLRAFAEERYGNYPKEELQAGCLAVYEAEKAQGTEMPAIVGVLEEHLEREEERLRREDAERYQRLRENERLAAEQRLLSGADCKWTPWQGKDMFCRANGRLYRLSETADKRVDQHRLESLDVAEGKIIGRYLKRGDATKAVALVAYQPEPR